jgi:mRNA interferase RelE/StbE
MYTVVITRSAEKEIIALPREVRERVRNHILALRENPRPPGAIKLQGQEAYRLRVGDYRIIYTIEDEVRLVMVIQVGHRREVYR